LLGNGAIAFDPKLKISGIVLDELVSPLQSAIDLTDEQFWQLCHRNREYRFETSSQGVLIIMPPIPK
jgi:hypothetical protein